MPHRPFILLSVVLTLLVYASGMVAVVNFQGTWNVSRFLFMTVDMSGMLAMAALAVILATISTILPRDTAVNLGNPSFRGGQVALLTTGLFLLALVATHVIYDAYAPSMDEWMPRLQAGIFLDGALTAQLPDEWRPFGRAMFHNFATYDPVSGEVASSYRPGLAMLIALFDLIHAGVYISSFAYAGSVWLTWVVARQMLPGQTTAPALAALLVATSQQAFAGAMTTYAMPSHLFFNLLWLHLFLRDRLWAHLAAAVIGVVTASLHQVHMHFLFAAPFLLTLLRPFRPGTIALYFFVNLAGHLAIIGWDNVLIRQAAENAPGVARTTAENITRILRLPDSREIATLWANVTRFFGWQSLALIPLLLVALRAGRQMPRWSAPLIGSITMSLLPYLFLMPDQGHGWGFRYLHGLIASFALLAAFGWTLLPRGEQAARFRAFCILGLVVTPIALLPLRAMQISGFTRPYAQASAHVHAMDADVVVVDNFAIFVGADIPRNDPTNLTTPIVMTLRQLDTEAIALLCERGSVNLFGVPEAAKLGLRDQVVSEGRRDAHARRLAALSDAGCSRR